MTTTPYHPHPCELVAERCALGEPLAELAEHAADCATCQALQATATSVAALHRDVDPGMGFASRMTVATQKRLTERRRNRIAGGLAGTVVAGTLGVFVMTRGPGALPDRPAPVVHAPDDTSSQPAGGNDDADADTEALNTLVRFSDVDTNAKLSARWSRITRPLAPYRALVKGPHR